MSMRWRAAFCVGVLTSGCSLLTSLDGWTFGDEEGADAGTMDAGRMDAGPMDASVDAGSMCEAGETRCGAQCVDLSTSPEHCGACGMACEAPPNAVPICVDESCSSECMPGFSDCNGDPSDGCEVELASDRENCGGCGLVCQDALSCREGACRPKLVWWYAFGGAGQDRVSGVALDPEGNVYITGYYSGTIDLNGRTHTSTGRAAIVASYTATGEYRWSLSSNGSGAVTAAAIAFDPSGTSPKVHITGGIQGTVTFGGDNLVSAGGFDTFIASFDAERGGHLASRSWGGSYNDFVNGIAVDPSGNLYVTGDFQGTANLGDRDGPLTSGGLNDIFVASYTPAPSYTSGSARWAKSFGGLGEDRGQAIFVDGSGNVYVTGSFERSVNFGGDTLGPAGVRDVFLASFRSNGVHRYSMSAGGRYGDRGFGVTADGTGKVYLTGAFNSDDASFGGAPLSSAGGGDIFLASYEEESDSGELRLAHRDSMNAGGETSDEGWALAMSPRGRVYSTGFFTGEADFGGGALMRIEQPAFVAAHEEGEEGRLRHVSSFAIGGESGSAWGYSIAARAQLVCVGGSFTVSVTLGEETEIAVGSEDGFIACFEP